MRHCSSAGGWLEGALQQTRRAPRPGPGEEEAVSSATRELAMVLFRQLLPTVRSAVLRPVEAGLYVDEVGEALQMNPRDFKEKYSEAKPSKSDSLVFSCLAGVRSKKALDTALSLGFKSAQHYAGGWKEWVTYEFSEKKQGN
ncbi:thiosulfate sulfurtransferase/rhodanese-like domain-containing protein 3 isoform X2 [Tupaia chinensis]|uniref:thiosulfate sulfurtransferase/rhodanese-like domain-containing protein 3 isoform X2 n=1 Tax=Tupaia chinensis TaxID=246437 RepID=UPI000FFB490C|nr:thiosulfate sulfurtransferase/rhodanese-like domain-containing protein 3 isoform X2 [Tupaia chinensis]